MSDRMRPLPFSVLMKWILNEMESRGTIFSVSSIYRHKGGSFKFLGQDLENPFGPAAGPHTQLAQNIISAYAAGARFFELKTVQTFDGENIQVSKPCIDARDECYNVEWSTELTVGNAFDEYVKAWAAIRLISKEYGLGDPGGFMFNMSVGYDYEGISSPKIDSFIEGLKDASSSKIWRECLGWASENAWRFRNVGIQDIESISPRVCSSITLSTLHGCPSHEIEKIAHYLLSKKGLNTFVKINPTLIGYERARETLDNLGFGSLSFDDRHFREDLQYSDAVQMISRLSAVAEKKGLVFGAKLTNTLPVNNPGDVMSGGEMYMSGRALFPLTAITAGLLAEEFDGRLPLSWSGGADMTNVISLVKAGIFPVTMATTLLKPGGYNRLKQMAELFYSSAPELLSRISLEGIREIIAKAGTEEWYRKPLKQDRLFPEKEKLPLTDCFIAPCSEGCPIGQDVPGYISLVGEHKFGEALELILDKNPLPFITGTICTHKCMACCTRNHYEEPVRIRDVKLKAAEKGFREVIDKIRPAELRTKAKAAVIGGGPAGLASAYFLQRYGLKTVIFERQAEAGGVVRHVIPDFRIGLSAVERDIEIIKKTGAELVLGAGVSSLEELRNSGYKYIIIAGGAWKHEELGVKSDMKVNALNFLASFKKEPAKIKLGRNVIVIGGGNTAMDSARAAKRIKGVRTVSIVYRRTAMFMPAEEEELRLAVEDGIIFRELLQPLSHEDGRITCAVMTLGPVDQSGRSSPVPTGQTVSIPADTLIEAVGENIDSDFFTDNNIFVDHKGRPLTDRKSYETNIKGVYVAGDARLGPKTVVEAIADARHVADEIALKEGLNLIENGHKGDHDLKTLRAKKGELVFYRSLGKEPDRCLECGVLCENCVDVCPNRANISVLPEGASSPQVVHIDTLCNECGNCSTFCPWAGSPYKDKFTFFLKEKDFYESRNSGFFTLGKDKFKIRLEGRIFTSELDPEDNKLPADIAALIKAAMKSIPI